ncbi:MAG TPA: GAF domain-containing protein [Miltoncostaeaceae bacterium]|nr:GAF domain-containing protein [Miltoncostaeaceae bacterium]
MDLTTGQEIGPGAADAGRALVAGLDEHHLRMLAEMWSIIDSPLSESERLRELARLAVPAIGDWCSIELISGEALLSALVAHEDPDRVAAVASLRRERPIGESGVVEEVIRTGRPVLIRSVTDDQLAASAPDEEHLEAIRSLGIRSAIVAPMVARGATLGALTVVTAESGRSYGDGDLAFVREVARRAAAAIDNARLFDAERSAREAAESEGRRLAALQRITSAFAHALAPEDVASAALDEAMSVTGAMRGTCMLASEDGDALEGFAFAGYPEDVGPQVRRIPLTARVPSVEAFASGVPWFADSAAEVRARYPDLDAPTGGEAFAAVPLLLAGQPIGALTLRFGRRRAFGEEDRAFLFTLAQLAAGALARARRFRAEQDAHERATLLVRAGEALDAGIGVEARLSRLLEVIVPRVADVCMIELMDGDARVPAIVRAEDPETERGFRELRARASGAPPGQAEWVRATGEPVLMAEMDDLEWARNLARLGAEGEIERFRTVRPRSAVIVPIVARGRRTGIIMLVSTRTDRRYGPDDLVFAEELGRRAGLAVDNARLYEQAQRAAAVEQARGRRLDAMAEASLAVHQQRALDERVRVVADRARQLVGANLASAVVFGDAGWHDAIVGCSRSTRSAAWAGHEHAFAVSDLAAGVSASGRTVRLGRRDLPVSGAAPAPQSPPRPRTLLAIPLVGQDGSALGVLQLADRYVGDFTDEDQALLEEYARMAALAVGNARLEERERQVAHTLQESLLPGELPTIPGVALAARYTAGGAGTEVGGDLYDVFPWGDDWLVLVGDVCGKGAQAAALTALVRYTIRAESMREDDPARVLRLLNTAILRQRSDGRFCTLALARLTRSARGATLHLACAGHPPPLVRRRSGRIERLLVRGGILGFYPEVKLGATRVELGLGDTMLMFTDGASEARGPDGMLGVRGLERILREAGPVEPGVLAAEIEREVVEHASGSVRDDMALLVLTILDGVSPAG